MVSHAFSIQCSNCGSRRVLNAAADSLDAVKEGWGSFGSALYCPACSASWGVRNNGRPMADQENTIRVILTAFFTQSEN